MNATTVLVSCVGAKRSNSCAARDLYTSVWFLKARRYAENYGTNWFVLSAKFGLLLPGEIVAPYEMTLNTMPPSERRQWALKVFEQIRQQHVYKTVEILAGGKYRSYLAPLMEKDGYKITVPMEGLGIGQQLQWLSKR
jgi:hypothetical protein